MSEAGRRPLSRQRILEAAVGLVDREGLEALSMRRLGAELGVEAMSLYNHVPNKEAVLDGMVEVLLAGVRISFDDEDGWEERVREVLRSFRGLARAHPEVFPLFAVRPSNASRVVGLLPVFLEAMRGSGFDVRTSLRAFRTLSSYAIGYALAEVRGTVTRSARGRDDSRDLPGQDTRLSEEAPLLGEADHDDEFEFGLDLILAGLQEYITRR